MTAPDRTLAFMQALWALDHALQRVSKRMAATLGVTGPQRLALRVLGAEPRITAGRLARELHLDPSTVAGVLARLEGKGYIRRVADRTDARRARIVLTAKGRRVHEHVAGTVEEAIDRVLASASAADAQAAIGTISAVARALRADNQQAV